MKAALLTLLLGVNLPTADAKAKVYGFGSTAGPQYLESLVLSLLSHFSFHLFSFPHANNASALEP